MKLGVEPVNEKSRGKKIATDNFGIDGREIAPDAPGLHIIRTPDGIIQKALKLSK